MTENQKLREALSELMSIVSIHQKATGNNFAWAEMDFAREALALPTAAQVDDINVAESFTSAAPVGEREAFEKWILDATGYIGASVKRDQEGQYKSDITESAWDAWQARAALSAGDAVDGQSNASRWVASADRYPPEGERVFFLDLATNIVGFDMWAGEGFMWMPSHWMPIPPAPAMRKGQL